MKFKTLMIGIASFKAYKARSLAIAKGNYKPNKNEPKVWFSSIESFAQILSTKNQQLLEIIATKHPDSITELAKLSGREKSNLSRTLKTMEHYGLIELKPGEGRELIPSVPYGHFKVDWEILNNG